jgi:uncharacterized protein (TIGR03437 family)
LTSPILSVPSNGIVHAATFQAGAGVSPGELITIFGIGLGPQTLAYPAVTPAGFLDSTAGGTQVLFDGRPAPLVYSLTSQVTAIVPYEVAGQSSTNVTVTYRGQTSTAVSVPVVVTAPGLFTALSSGSGAAALLNQDGLSNSRTFGAPRGSVVVLFATGEGQTNPSGVDGLLANAVYPKPIANVSVTIGGQPAFVQYAGAAPTLVAGVLQVNAVVPSNITTGASVPVVLTVGGVSSRSDVTLSVVTPDASRSGKVAYFNNGTGNVTVSVFAPGASQPSESVVVPPNANLFVGSVSNVQNDWGVQAAGSKVRVMEQVCSWNTGNGGVWLCTGNASAPFPR